MMDTVLPNFLIIGAMKAGTTSLHEYLASHPSVFMSTPKELRFFSGENWGRGMEWYEAHFAAAQGGAAVGESSPAYSQADIFPDAPRRIVEALPGVRIVYVVREPIGRMRSMYVHLVASGRERRPMAEALREDPVYLNSSRYRWQLDHYLPHVGPDRVHVLTSDDLLDRRAEALGRILAFLEVDDGWTPPVSSEQLHQSSQKRARTAVSLRLGRYSWYRSASRRLPPRVRRLTARVTSRPIDAPPELPDRLVEEMRERLAPDVAALRELLPAGWDGWGIA